MLNELQQKAYDHVINKESKSLLLIGQAGTGKSFTVSEIIKGFTGKVAVTATTNKAKDLLGMACGVKTFTVQSFMGYTMIRHGYEMHLSDVRPNNHCDLLIVDEVSMLPRAVYEKILIALKNKSIKQVLFIGDPIQLPAVGAGVDVDNIQADVIELTEQMRQDNSNTELLDYLERLRQAIKDGTTFSFTKDLPSNIKLLDSHREFCEEYKECEPTKTIVSFANRVVDSYNSHISKGDNRFSVGDEVVLDKPLGTSTVGCTAIINNVMYEQDWYKIHLTTSKGDSGTVYQWLTQDKYNTKLDHYKSKGDKDSYWHVVNWSFNLKHTHASTVHKSQGSTFETVFIDGTDILKAHNKAKSNYTAPPISYEMFLRLMYVGISRMKSKCYIYMGDSRDYKRIG